MAQVTKAVLQRLAGTAKSLAVGLMALWPGTVAVPAPGPHGPHANGAGTHGKVNLALAKNGVQVMGANVLPNRTIVHYSGWANVAKGAIPKGFNAIALGGVYTKSKGQGTYYYLLNVAPTATAPQIVAAFKQGGWGMAPTAPATAPTAPTAKQG